MNILTQSAPPGGIAKVDQLRAHASEVLAALSNRDCAHLATLMLGIGEDVEVIRRLARSDLIAVAAMAQLGFAISLQDARDAAKGDDSVVSGGGA